MTAGVKFVLLLIPGFIAAYILVAIAESLGISATQTALFEPIWWEHRQITENSGMIASWFKVIPWAFKYFSAYPLHVIVGLFSAWGAIIIFVAGISFAASWSGLVKNKPKAE